MFCNELTCCRVATFCAEMAGCMTVVTTELIGWRTFMNVAADEPLLVPGLVGVRQSGVFTAIVAELVGWDGAAMM